MATLLFITVIDKCCLSLLCKSL